MDATNSTSGEILVPERDRERENVGTWFTNTHKSLSNAHFYLPAFTLVFPFVYSQCSY